MHNENLHAAKVNKNDEFYTRIEDISRELYNYRNHFKGKIVYCNCDDAEWSAFWKYFHLNFEFFGLKKLISTHYDRENPTYKMEYEGGNDNDCSVGVKTPLKGNGDFRNQECIDILKTVDIVATNPPFSLFREYVAQLEEYGKKFVIIGSMNAITYKEIFPLIKENKLWLGYNSVKEFIQPDGTTKKFGNILWYTNLDIPKRHNKTILYKKYTPEEYPKYDNYDAINVDRCDEIPEDYLGVMGVPITFLCNYNPDEFEIVSFRKGEDGNDLVFTREREREFNRTFVSLYDIGSRDDKERRRKDSWEAYLRTSDNSEKIEPIDLFYPIATNLKNGMVNDCTINGKKTYCRMLIKRR